MRLIGFLILSSAFMLTCKPRKESSGAKLRDADKLEANNLPREVSMNDLSYMFPKHKNGEVYPKIDLSKDWDQKDVDPEKAIFRKSLYDQILPATLNLPTYIDPKNGPVKQDLYSGNPTKNFEYESWRVVSFRIDPCAPTLAMDANRSEAPDPLLASQIRTVVSASTGNVLQACSQQIRLIVQPINSKGVFQESSIHLVYRVSLNTQISKAMIQDILELKAAGKDIANTDKAVLQPHPTLSKELESVDLPSNYGPFAKKVMAFLKKYLSDSKLVDPTNIAIVRSTNTSTGRKDQFIGAGAVVSDPTKPSTFIAFPMATLPKALSMIVFTGKDKQTFSIDPEFASVGDVKDAQGNTIESKSIVSLYKKSKSQGSFSDADRALLLKLDNPEITHFFGADCISCHGASQLMQEAGIDNFLNDKAKLYKVALDLGGYPKSAFLPPARDGSNLGSLRNFGYVNNKVVITNRTITETASVVDYLNRRLAILTETKREGLARLGIDIAEIDKMFPLSDGGQFKKVEDLSFQFLEAAKTCEVTSSDHLAVSGQVTELSIVQNVFSIKSTLKVKWYGKVSVTVGDSSVPKTWFSLIEVNQNDRGALKGIGPFNQKYALVTNDPVNCGN